MISESQMIAATSQTRYTAEVRAPDGVRFSATAHCPDTLSSLIVDYIGERCDHVLWPHDAREVRALIGQNRRDAAIALYFERVGQRWDEESLELELHGSTADGSAK